VVAPARRTVTLVWAKVTVSLLAPLLMLCSRATPLMWASCTEFTAGHCTAQHCEGRWVLATLVLSALHLPGSSYFPLKAAETGSCACVGQQLVSCTQKLHSCGAVCSRRDGLPFCSLPHSTQQRSVVLCSPQPSHSPPPLSPSATVVGDRRIRHS